MHANTAILTPVNIARAAEKTVAALAVCSPATAGTAKKDYTRQCSASAARLVLPTYLYLVPGKFVVAA